MKSTPTSNENSQEVQRVARQSALYDVVTGVAGDDALETTADLMCVCIRLLAEYFPGDMSKEALIKIQENYADATESLMRERAMSPNGVKVALAMCENLGRIALDYSPASSFKEDMAKDGAASEAVAIYGAALQEAYKRAVSQGLSVFGAVTTMVLAGTALGGHEGLGTQRLARPLIDALLLSFKFDQEVPVAESAVERKAAFDRVVAQVAQQMGISIKQARKYLVIAEQEYRDDKLVD